MYPFAKIEKKWTAKWLTTKIYEPDLKKSKRPFYNLMMFPYPSAEGLHVGNAYAFTGSDIFGRFTRMQGYDVLEPIGLDGFGIHSENYALKIGKHPMKVSKITEKNFYRQLLSIGNGFAWSKRLETYAPDYYKWTQWIFLQLYKRGLAYRKKQAVNWCPSCKTVLADEQVLPAGRQGIAGKCERCSFVVQKKELEQWFFKITKYASRLLKNLDKIDWPEAIKIAQRNWIGKSDGSLITFPIKGLKEGIEVFTTRADTLFGATYMVLAPEHELVQKLKPHIKNWNKVSKYVSQAKKKSENDRIKEGRVKTGVELEGVKAVNPANQKEIPVWVADFVIVSYGTGAVFADAHDERDFAFAKKYGIPLKPTLKTGDSKRDARIRRLEECFTGDGILFDSGRFSGLFSEKAKWEITKFVGGEKRSQYRLRDWLISRQRYWGPPIPLVFCENCAVKIKNQKSKFKNPYSLGELENPGWIAIPEKDLPVKLPYIKNFRPTGRGESPLASVKSFYEVKCPKCGGKARRETDVSDTFLDSAWYFLRYVSVDDKTCPWRPEAVRKWLPVNMYIGGAEHSVLHLLYSRFLTMVFKDTGLISHFEEPFTTFRAHGLLISGGAKMSKSKGNVVVPDEYIKKFGADTLRLYLMFLGPFEVGGDWRDEGIVGLSRFLNRVWKFSDRKFVKTGETSVWLNNSIKKVTNDIANLHYNTAISELMIDMNHFEKEKEMSLQDFKTFLLMLAPFAPFISEELWTKIGGKYSIHNAAWPKVSEARTQENCELIFLINGKLRGKVVARMNLSENEAKTLALSQAGVKKRLEGKKIQKIIFVPNRLINFVI